MIMFWARVTDHFNALTSLTAPHPLNPHQCPTSHWPSVITTQLSAQISGSIEAYYYLLVFWYQVFSFFLLNGPKLLTC